MTLWATEYPVFDDIRFPLSGERLYSPAGNLTYDFTECTVDFKAASAYPGDPICMVAQMPHKKKFGVPIRPHIHWVQELDFIPNWLLASRFYNNGDVVPAFSLAAHTGVNKFAFSSGILQLTEFPRPAPPDPERISAVCDFILYRDSANVSGLFAGADPYGATVAGKEFDCHVVMDSQGSRQEYKK
jgi:hypothetical protein